MTEPPPRPAAPASRDVSIDWDNYQPGDVFANVFTGLPGFEEVERRERAEPANTSDDPFVSFDRHHIVFAAQQVNTTSAAESIDLVNSGGSAGTIVALDLDDAGTDFEFRLRPDGGFPVKVPAHGEAPLADVHFAPRSAGEKTMTLTVDDGIDPSPQVVLRGTAVDEPVQTAPRPLRRADDISQWSRGDLGVTRVTLQPTDVETWPIDRVARHVVGLVLATLTNFDTALHLFENAATRSSLDEAKLAATLSVAGDALRKAVLDKLVAFCLKGLPGAGIVGDLAKLGDFDQKAHAAVKHAEAARADHQLRQFLATLIKEVGDARAAIEQNQERRVHEIQQAEARALDRERFRGDILTAAADHEAALSASLSSAGLFGQIAARWIHDADHRSGRIDVDLDRDFRCTRARIVAPGASRLAEGLLRANGGTVDLGTIPVEREVRWFPERSAGDSDDNRFIKAKVHANHEAVVLHSAGGDPSAEHRAFFDRLRRFGLPSVTSFQE